MQTEYISRQKALEAIKSKEKEGVSDFYSGMMEGLSCALHAVMDVPSAEVVQVAPGKWLKQYHGQVNSICSVCGKESGRRTDFCPNCGAKMDKG